MAFELRFKPGMLRYVKHRRANALFVLAVALFSAPRLAAQTAEATAKTTDSGWVWIEQFAGATNTYGQIFATTSTAGYNFNSHVGVIGGVPYYFIRNTSSTTVSSTRGVGDVFGGLRLAWATPIVNYRMALTGAAPSGDSTIGLGAGRATYDWSHRLDRGFGRWTPFVEAGLTNSPSAAVLVQRQFTSTGHAAHFEAGSALRLFGPITVSGSVYDIEPWGTQTVLSRVVARGGPPAGVGRNSRAFEVSQQTIGGSDLTRDRGFNAGVGLSLGKAVELWTGFNHSSHFDLNTVSFGVAVNILGLARQAHE
jgi:hypothetical protein